MTSSAMNITKNSQILRVFVHFCLSQVAVRGNKMAVCTLLLAVGFSETPEIRGFQIFTDDTDGSATLPDKYTLLLLGFVIRHVSIVSSGSISIINRQNARLDSQIRVVSLDTREV